MINICRYTQDKQTEWDAFVKVSKNGTFLFLRAYMDYHSDRFTDHSLMYYNEKGRLIAVLPANGRVVNPSPDTHQQSSNTQFFSHQGLTYGGFVLAPKVHIVEVEELFKVTITYLQKSAFSKWHYKQIPYIYHRLPSQEEDYCLWRCNAVETACNMMTVIDYDSSAEEIVSSRKRTYLNKLHRQGYVMELSADIRAFWPILENNLMERFGSRPVHSLSEIQLLMARFPQNIVCAVVKNPDGVVMAGTVLFITQHVVRTQYISATHEGKQTNVLDFLMLSLVEHYHKDSRYRYFEFGTSMAEDGIHLNDGLILQKEGFGGRAVAAKVFCIQL